MDAVNDAIEAAARVLCDDYGPLWDEAEEWERNMHRATAAVLHKAGMLATIPEYAEGWDTEANEPEHWPIPVKDCAACDGATPNYVRFTTEWREVTE